MSVRTSLNHHGSQGNRQQLMQQASTSFSKMEQSALREDADTVNHENAHATLAGSFGGSISYDYRTIAMTMPDGSQKSLTYRAGGHVPISMPAINVSNANSAEGRSSLQSALSGLHQIQAAALAPGSPSSADISIANAASQKATSIEATLNNPTKQAGGKLNLLG